MAPVWAERNQTLKRRISWLAALLAALMMLSPGAQAAELPETQAAASAGEQAAASAEDWQLLLVNPWHTLPEGFQVELKTLPNGMQVDQRIYGDLTAMLADCKAAGLRPLVCSAYRSVETQTRLYRNKITRLRAAGYAKDAAVTEAGRWVAVPGTSEHQTGLAVDLVAASYQVLDRNQEQTAEQKWLMEHCWEYGFILRYPTEKCEITGIGYEPWHYRYVGKAAAAALHENGLCLEEYLETLEAAEKTSEQAKNAGTPQGSSGIFSVGRSWSKN